MESNGQNGKRQIVAALAVLIVIAVIAAGVIVTGKGDEADNTASTTTSQTATTIDSTAADTATDTTASSTAYKDGTYTAVGGYNSPGGAEKISVTVTIKDGKVTDTSAKGEATGGEAEYYQEDFVNGYKDQVIGKDISSLKLSRVSGASLTTNGFNNAITQIKSQAQS